MAAPFDLNTAEAASMSSSIGKDSLAGTPRVKLIVSISLDFTGSWSMVRRSQEPGPGCFRPSQHLQPGGRSMRALVVAALIGTAFVAAPLSQTARNTQVSDSLERSFPANGQIRMNLSAGEY